MVLRSPRRGRRRPSHPANSAQRADVGSLIRLCSCRRLTASGSAVSRRPPFRTATPESVRMGNLDRVTKFNRPARRTHLLCVSPRFVLGRRIRPIAPASIRRGVSCIRITARRFRRVDRVPIRAAPETWYFNALAADTQGVWKSSRTTVYDSSRTHLDSREVDGARELMAAMERLRAVTNEPAWKSLGAIIQNLDWQLRMLPRQPADATFRAHAQAYAFAARVLLSANSSKRSGSDQQDPFALENNDLKGIPAKEEKRGDRCLVR